MSSSLESGVRHRAVNADETSPLLKSEDDVRVALRRSLSHREEARLEKEQSKDRYDTCKNFSFIFIGVLTFVYTLAELGLGTWYHILVLMSDGFHNLSDVVALGIGLWASKKSRAAKSMQYSYGFARTELLGALVNGCFLLSLALYVLLEAIPKFIRPELPEDNISFYFIIGAGVGLGLNITGALVFFITGRGHSHAGHSHEHGGHAEVEKKKEKKTKEHHDHHGDGAKKKKSKKKDKGHGHDHHGHSHASGSEHGLKEVASGEGAQWAEVEPLLVSDDDNRKGKGSSHDHTHDHDHDHDHDHNHDHAHSHKDKHEDANHKDDHGHSHASDKSHHGHAHEHADEHEETDGHSHSHAGSKHADHNLYAIFLHFLGDALSSVFVLTTALLWYFFPIDSSCTPMGSACKNYWVVYIDPATSIIVVGIILYTTIPLVRSVLAILLQKVPRGVDADRISKELLQIPGVVTAHDLHIWELVSGMNLASVHLDCRGNGEDFQSVLQEVRRVFHRNKIHSVTVQPEFVGDHHPGRQHCESMCVSECIETWCCEPDLEVELNTVVVPESGW